MKRLKELRGMMMEAEACVAVTVRKLVMVSLMEIFKDISPTYRIRPLTAAEKNVKVTASVAAKIYIFLPSDNFFSLTCSPNNGLFVFCKENRKELT